MEVEGVDAMEMTPNGNGLRGYLVWEELTAIVPSYIRGRPSKKILAGMSGYAVPGRMLAVMGPSGSGKSTLLDSLAGRLGKNVLLTGTVLLDGRKQRLDYGVVAYVTQETSLLGTLTVRETLSYSAKLRLPKTMKKEEIEVVVEATIDHMGLQSCVDTPIGNWHLRGISGGEKKRLSIALEVLTQPTLLFLDEPSSGLDSASAFFVVQTLRGMAREGRTVVASVHQPSSEVFELFDDLCILASGELVYFGDARLATEFFALAGFRCPRRRNPSDHFLRCVNTDFDRVNATIRESRSTKSDTTSGASFDPLTTMETIEIRSILIDRFRSSQYADTLRQKIEVLSHIVEETSYKKWGKQTQAGWWKQLVTLTARSSVNMSRDMSYYWLRIIIYILVAVCVGTIFFNIGTSNAAIFARAACGGFVSGFMTFMSIGGFPSFIEEMRVFQRERLNGHYGVLVYILSNLFSSFPFLLLISISSGTIVYYMVKLHPGFSCYAYFIIVTCASIAVVESLMMIVASMVPNFLMGIITGAGILGVMMMSAGFFRLLPDLPKPVWRYPISYVGYGSWAMQGLLKNDMIGLGFDSQIPHSPKIRGEDIVENMWRVELNHSKWWDLAAIFMLLLSYRIIFFLVLKVQERASNLLHLFHIKIVLGIINRRDSLKKRSSLCSRKQTLHPMAVQEGLTSPIP